MSGRIVAVGTFRARLVRPPGVGTWTFASVPTEVLRAGGLRARMRVTGTVDGVPFRSSLMPRGGGDLFVVIPQPLRDQIGKQHGHAVNITLRADLRAQVLAVPPDFRRALGKALARFTVLAPSHQKAFLQWIEGAKRPETRTRRIAEAARMVLRGENRN
jgi:antitoxin component of MazEF toxin-antitoxin module